LSVAFVPTNADGNGHHFFSAAKDKMIKYFDGDKFEQIQKLQGHHGEIWAMTVAHSGLFVVTASHDKSIRVWTQTDEQVFLEEEREKELEELYESTLVTGLEQDDRDADGAEEEGSAAKVVGAGKQTVETLMAGEKIAEALEIGMEDLEVMREYEETNKVNAKAAKPQRNPVFLAHGGVSASVYVLNAFQRIPAASLQDALLVLSFSQLPSLLTFLALWAREGRNVALTCRVLFFMLKVHQRQVVSSGQLKGALEVVKAELRRQLKREKEELGFNLAGLRVLGRRVGDEVGEKRFVDSAESEVDGVDGTGKGNGGRKRAFVNIA
jgi:U3 small nucleolar RNA-associated protein 12